jgi:hypothetical protein
LWAVSYEIVETLDPESFSIGPNKAVAYSRNSAISASRHLRPSVSGISSP